jgi:hypothetical protein
LQSLLTISSIFLLTIYFKIYWKGFSSRFGRNL